MIILGIDPGLKATGYGFVDYSNKSMTLLETGAIRPKQKDLIQNRIHRIYTVLDELVTQYQPGILVLEKLYSHYKYTTTASILGHIRGVICLLCAQKNIDLAEYSVKRIRKAVTGNGNASKTQTQRIVTHMLNIDSQRLSLDASDACALALGYIQMCGRRL